MRLLFTLFVIGFLQVGFSQFKKPTFISISPKGGFIFGHRPNMSHLIQKNSYSFELAIWQQETGNNDTTFRLKNPMRGLALEFRNFGYDEVLGKAFSITEYMVFPMHHGKNNLCLDLTMGTGIGFLTKRYDKYENPLNNAIGSVINARVNVKLSLTKYTKKMHFGAGIEIAHFSNGAVKNPNLGINAPSISFLVGYNFNEHLVLKSEDRKERKKGIELADPHRLLVELIGSAKEIGAIPFYPKLYPVVATRISYGYSKRGLWGVDGGMDVIYNESIFHKYNDTTFVRNDILQVGLYVGGFAHFYKSQIVFGLGYNVRDKIDPEGRVYNRIGLRYWFHKKWFGLFTIRANYGKADYFEFGIGYQILRW